MAVKTRTIDGKTCVTSAFLAEIFGVTVKTLLKWEKKGCPKAARGYWCPAQVMQWKTSILDNPEKDVEGMTAMQRKIHWEAECKKAQTEAQQLKNAATRGEYLEKAQAEREAFAFFTVFKQMALSMPRRAAVLCAQYIGDERARQVENEMGNEVRNVLEQWSAGKFDSGMDQTSANGTQTAGETDGKRMGGQKPRTRRKKQQ